MKFFSDTVNTGTYILEPEVLKYLPQDEECDFSKDLFPQLLEMEEPMYGYIADAYWCDVGHLEAYREAHYSALEKEVELQFPYREIDQGVWIGENTYIHPTAIVESPVLIGSNCRIGERAKILAGTIIGDNVTIGDDAELHRPIIWNGVIVGEESSLSACIIARGTRIDRRSQILEGAVIGSLCNIGEESQINIGVRVWPNKRIEPGAMLNINLIWGNIAHSNLFGQRGGNGTRKH